MQDMHLNEFHWLRFGKIRLQEFSYSQRVYCLSYLINIVERPHVNLSLATKNLGAALYQLTFFKKVLEIRF